MTDHRSANAERTLTEVQGFRKNSDGFVNGSGDVRALILEEYDTVDMFGRPIPEEKQTRQIRYWRT